MLNLHMKDTITKEGMLASILEEHRSLLSCVKEGEAVYVDSLGWMDIAMHAGVDTIENIEKIARRIQADADIFVLIGVGGSNNAARAVIEALKPAGFPRILYAGNTLSAHATKALLEELEGKSVYINCIAKNFETLEPGVAFRILRQYLYRRYGEEAKERIIATGTKGSSLEKLCEENEYTFLEFPLDVGGRFSALTNVGLLPMAVAGIDIRTLVQGAMDIRDQLLKEDADTNIAYRYACIRNSYYKSGYRIEMLSCFEPQMHFFYKWWIQLFGESEGKEDRGIFPVAGEFSEELHALGQFIQSGDPRLFETFLEIVNSGVSHTIESDTLVDGFSYLDGMDLDEINRSAYQATLEAHAIRLPCMCLQIEKIDAYHFGILFYFFMFACYLSARILDVHPFDQPGVEAYKVRMFEALGKK